MESDAVTIDIESVTLGSTRCPGFDHALRGWRQEGPGGAVLLGLHGRVGAVQPWQLRNRADFARFFEGMDLVPPGIVAAVDWHSELPPSERPSAAEVGLYGAVARIS